MTQPLTDEKLFELCQKYGAQAELRRGAVIKRMRPRLWRQKFAGLLPEVARRELYAKKGFYSIFEFAAKLAGMSEEQVRRILNLGEKFADKPILKSLLEDGAVSANKLARIASIATSENQEFLAQQVQILPKSALETLVRDQSATGNSVPGHRITDQELILSNDVKEKLFVLQQKGIDINALLRDFLEKRELEIAQKKERLMASNKPISRYIPVEIRNIVEQEHGTKCSIPTCQKEAETIHHTQRFALSKNHDPHFLAPLCKDHHLIAHSIDMNFHNVREAALALAPP